VPQQRGRQLEKSLCIVPIDGRLAELVVDDAARSRGQCRDTRERERERERRIALARDVQRSQRRVQLGQRRELGLAELLVHAALSHSIVELADEHMVGLRRAAPCSQCAIIIIIGISIIIALLLLQQLAFLASASLSLPLAHILLLLLVLMLVLVFEAKLLSRPLHRERARHMSN